MAVPLAGPTSKLPPTVRYAEAEYWESRYKREPAVFEWFFGHTALRRIIRACISKKKPVLHVGCGTSNLQEGMAQSGYNVVNTDISQVVISQMTERHAKYTNMTYQVSDCRNMPEFMDCQFGSVIDKGTVDALLCCKQGTDNVRRMLKEVHRVLQPGGNFLLVTLGDPTRRLPLLLQPPLNWKVTLLLLPKISAACQAYVDGKPINDTVHPIDADGPYEVLGPDTIVGLPPGVQYSNFFFAYVCKRQPLQLPLAQGQKAQLPNGWVAGSKELFQKLQKELGLPEDLLAKGRRKRVVVMPVGASSTMAGFAHSSQTSSSGSSSYAATAHGTPKKYDQGLSPGREDQQQQAAAVQSASHALSTQLQQQQAAVAKLETLLAANAQQQLGLSQRLPTVSGIDTRDIPTRPASAPNLANLMQLSGAAQALPAAASTAAVAGAAGPVLPPAHPSLPAQGSEQVLQVSEHVPCIYGGPAAAGGGGGEAVQQAVAVEYVTQSVAAAGIDSTSQSVAAASSIGASSFMCTPAAASTSVADTGQKLGGVPAAAAAALQLMQQPDTAAMVQCSAEAAAPEAAAVEVAAGRHPWDPPGRRGLAKTASDVSAEVGAAAAGEQEQQQQQWSMLGRPSPAEAAATAAGAIPMVGTSLIPLLPRPGAVTMGRAPRLRRFSTDFPAIRLAAFSTQLAMLRQQQSLHSERAADGLVMHDVPANEACGGAAAAAAAAFSAAMSWGRSRPPRCRRLSAVSNSSLISSTSVSAAGEEDLSEMTDEFASMCTTTADSHVLPEEVEEGQLSEAAEDGMSVELSGPQSPRAGPGLGPGFRPRCSMHRAELPSTPEVQEKGTTQKQGSLGHEHQHDQLQYDQRQQEVYKPPAAVPQALQQTGGDFMLQLNPVARKECDQGASQLPQSVQQQQHHQ